MTVREIVRQMLKFNAGSSCLCWQVFDATLKRSPCKKGTAGHTTTARLEVDRVTARCASAIFHELEQNVMAQYSTIRTKTKSLRRIAAKRSEELLMPLASTESCCTPFEACKQPSELFTWLRLNDLQVLLPVCEREQLTKDDLVYFASMIDMKKAASTLGVKPIYMKLLRQTLGITA
eukprot:TRINITY_DN11877_c0_g1_i2.p3 TRINITY_DN11877_c0_g1~~TRINITY_DN11877_c0_g1_i2.p3  ORF type:complete len:177 (+),score=29.14 TRINITY_DN11877_c0_g1_i2:3341-3871(+)